MATISKQHATNLLLDFEDLDVDHLFDVLRNLGISGVDYADESLRQADVAMAQHMFGVLVGDIQKWVSDAQAAGLIDFTLTRTHYSNQPSLPI